MRKVWGMVIAVVLLTAGAAFAQSAVSVVPVQSNGKIICTASSINQVKKLWLTAAHCIIPRQDEDDSIQRMLWGHKPKKVEAPVAAPKAGLWPNLTILGDPLAVVVADEVTDVAIVSTSRVSAPALKLAVEAPKVGDVVSMTGFPFGMLLPVWTEGKVAAETEPVRPDSPSFLLVAIPSAPGNSGSAVLNARGEVVSVLQIGFAFNAFTPMMGGVLFDTLATYREYFEPTTQEAK